MTVDPRQPDYIRPSQPRTLDGRFASGPVSFAWEGMTLLDSRMKEYGDRVSETRREVCERLAPLMESYMKQNAPWADRTSQARTGLFAKVQHQENSSMIVLGYSVFYGVFLEHKTYGGKSYAIVRPTLNYFAPHFMAEMRAGV